VVFDEHLPPAVSRQDLLSNHVGWFGALIQSSVPSLLPRPAEWDGVERAIGSASSIKRRYCSTVCGEVRVQPGSLGRRGVPNTHRHSYALGK
jgi:hypothetical protein